MAPYQTFKIFITDFSGVSKDGFHILLGFLIFILFAWIFRLKLSSWKAIIAPLVFAVILELMDARDSLAYGFAVHVRDSIKDIVVTTLIPWVTIIYLRYLSGETK